MDSSLEVLVLPGGAPGPGEGVCLCLCLCLAVPGRAWGSAVPVLIPLLEVPGLPCGAPGPVCVFACTWRACQRTCECSQARSSQARAGQSPDPGALSGAPERGPGIRPFVLPPRLIVPNKRLLLARVVISVFIIYLFIYLFFFFLILFISFHFYHNISLFVH